MKFIKLITLFLIALPHLASAKIYDVRAYGAKGDSTNIDSDAINRAIDSAAADGGGTVYVGAGTYLCFSIRLQSNITLHIETGAKLIAAKPMADRGYDVAEYNPSVKFQDFGHSHFCNSLIYAIGKNNIQIVGGGTIWGAGLSREESRLAGVGNKAISLRDCYNVNIQNIRMLRCGHFAVLATGVDNLSLQNIYVDTNRDGFDIDCCRNVRITDCSVNSPWDDAIVLKSSYALNRFKATENVTIMGCYVSGFDWGSTINATWQTDEPQAPDHGFNCGRIKIGTETSGDFKNIIVSNCIFDHCRGLAIEAVDGGVVEDIVCSNLVMRDIVNSPIFLRLGSRQRSPEGTPVGAMRRVRIQDVVVNKANSRYASIISGIPGHHIEDVVIKDVEIVYEGGFAAEDGKVLPPENERTYPEPWMFGQIPASGFFVRHATDVELRDIKIRFLKPDERPLFVEQDVNNFQKNNIKVVK